jgi:hypothetical protein
VRRWRLLLEEYAPEIVYIKGTHNTVADAISRLEYNPKLNLTNEYNHATQGVSTKDLAHQKWNTFSKHWRGYNETNSQSNTNRVHLNQVFVNCSEDDEIYPLTVFSPSSCRHNWLVVRVLEYLNLKVPKMSFGEESTRTDQPNFPPQHFWTKASRQRRTK